MPAGPRQPLLRRGAHGRAGRPRPAGPSRRHLHGGLAPRAFPARRRHIAPPRRGGVPPCRPSPCSPAPARSPRSGRRGCTPPWRRGRAGGAGSPSGPRAPAQRCRRSHLHAARDAAHVTPGGAGRAARPLSSGRYGATVRPPAGTAHWKRQWSDGGEAGAPAGRAAFPRGEYGAARWPAGRLRWRHGSGLDVPGSGSGVRRAQVSLKTAYFQKRLRAPTLICQGSSVALDPRRTGRKRVNFQWGEFI